MVRGRDPATEPSSSPPPTERHKKPQTARRSLPLQNHKKKKKKRGSNSGLRASPEASASTSVSGRHQSAREPEASAGRRSAAVSAPAAAPRRSGKDASSSSSSKKRKSAAADTGPRKDGHYGIEDEEANEWFEEGSWVTQQSGIMTDAPTDTIHNMIRHLRDGRKGERNLKQRFEQVRAPETSAHTDRKERRRLKAQKSELFWDLYGMFCLALKTGVREDRIEALVEWLAKTMDDFAHPCEIVGDFKPFSVLAQLCTICPLARETSKKVLRSASRLTLGASLSEMTEEDEKMMGLEMVLELTRLHAARREWLNDIGCQWEDGKFKEESTCPKCGNDPWEIFILGPALAMLRDGRDQDDNSDCESSDEDSGDESDSMTTDPKEYSELKIKKRDRIVPDSKSSRNHGPNAHILKIYTDRILFLSEEDACGAKKQKPCKECGYREDGKPVSKSSRFYKDMSHALNAARKHIESLPETIDLRKVKELPSEAARRLEQKTSMPAGDVFDGADDGASETESDNDDQRRAEPERKRIRRSERHETASTGISQDQRAGRRQNGHSLSRSSANGRGAGRSRSHSTSVSNGGGRGKLVRERGNGRNSRRTHDAGASTGDERSPSQQSQVQQEECLVKRELVGNGLSDSEDEDEEEDTDG